MSEETANILDFTGNAWEILYRTVDSARFETDDSELIYEAIQKQIQFVPFGEYLKRYIYEKTGMTGDYANVPPEDYQQTIIDSFHETHTPASFTPKTTRLSALVKNWLTQSTVSRQVVFLLGFGLSMTVEEVNDFLRKGIREQGINAKDPFEVICWYCYKNGYSYPKYESLMRIYTETDPGASDLGMLYDEYTISLRQAVRNLNSDAALIRYVLKLKTPDNRSAVSRSVYECFTGLYQETRETVADYFNAIEDEKTISHYGISRSGQKRKVYTAEDISGYDVEKVLYSAVPRDRHDNLIPVRRSHLNEQFNGYRIHRQRIADILEGRTEANRYDLLTLYFFVFSQRELDSYRNRRRRFEAFIEGANERLQKCWLSQIYVTNPYECFVLMCVLSDDPLGTFSDVNEMAYEE